MEQTERAGAGEADGMASATVADCSFIYFVYPFQFNPEDTDAHIAAIDAAAIMTQSMEPDRAQAGKRRERCGMPDSRSRSTT